MLLSVFRLPVQLFDPRGRASRRDFLAVAVALFALQVLALLLMWAVEEEAGRVSSLPLNVLFLYMATTATCRRLHDLGRSGWWLPLALILWMGAGIIVTLSLALVFGAHTVQPGAPVFWCVFMMLLVPPLLAALWLHLEDGDPAPNRFGLPPPDKVLNLSRRPRQRASRPVYPAHA